MKQLLIISPYWVSANLVGTQRYRLLANYLENYGWHPVVLAVEPQYYSMPLVPELEATVRPEVEIHYVNAFFGKGCFLGKDVSWRACWQLYQKALELIRNKRIDAMWVMIPSGIAPILARRLHDRTGIPYGIDYTDPWVAERKTRRCSKGRLLQILAPKLEAYSVRKVAFLAGVSELSYLPVKTRNSQLKIVPSDWFPLGFDLRDYDISLPDWRPIWGKNNSIKPFFYAGAFLPHSHYYIKLLFSIIAELRSQGQWDAQVRLYFVGTGFATPGIEDYAREYGLSDIVHETKERISYLNVLMHLKHAHGVWVIGSTEEHYTASKIFQNLLAKQPLFAVFHKASSVNDILKECNADSYLVKYDPEQPEAEFREALREALKRFLFPLREWAPRLNALDNYSALKIAGKLAALLNKVTEK